MQSGRQADQGWGGCTLPARVHTRSPHTKWCWCGQLKSRWGLRMQRHSEVRVLALGALAEGDGKEAGLEET